MITFYTNLIYILIAYLISMFVLVQIKRDTSIANFTWGGGCLLVGIYTIFALKNFLTRPILLTSMTTIWALRLIIYLYRRYTGHDPRFEKWKLEGLKSVILNLGYIFIGQFILLIIMSTPIYLVNTNMVQVKLMFLDYFGIVLWFIGIVCEATADQQLFTFLKNPANKGHVMDKGLWNYSRHPNYFGESLLWWGVFFIAINVQNGIWAIIAPITITFLLRFVSGVRLLENAMKHNPEYQEYKKHTNVFVPWFKK